MNSLEYSENYKPTQNLFFQSSALKELQNKLSTGESELGSAFPQMIPLLSLVKPGLEMVVLIKFRSLYLSDPNLQLMSTSGVRAQNHYFITDLFELISRE